jgi:uncharacterized membrane protein SpoIIM required for sporulation
MVLESIITPFKAEKRPAKLLLLGAIFCSVAIMLSLWIFKSQSSLIMVFLTSMAAIPLIYNTLRMEEEKDLEGMEEKWLLKEHAKALKAFVFLFIGATIAFAFWYTLLRAGTVEILFQAQSTTINAINGRMTGHLNFSANMGFFSKIFLNNVKVLIFCILFSFVYGSGAIFILMWNASVIGTAIGNFMRSELAKAASLIGFDKVAHYFQVITLGLFRYSIHGVPEILAYFVGGLAGGIIGIAVIKHDFGTAKFEHILLDAADLLLLSLGILFLAAILEVFVTPIIF